MPDGTLYLYSSAPARDAATTKLDGAAFTERHMTFGEFAALLDKHLPLSNARKFPQDVGDGAARSALLAQAAEDAAAGELTRIADSPRALAAAAKLIAAWKGVQLRPEQIRAAAEQLSSKPESARPGAAMRRIARLYELYEKRLGAAFIDREARERDLLKRLAASTQISARLLEPGLEVQLIGFHRLAFFQRRVIQHLLRLKHRVVAKIPMGVELPRCLAATFAGTQCERAASASAAAPAFLCAPTPYAEVYEIGRRVYRWIEKERIAPAEIAVAFRDLGPYSQALHDVFTRLKIPFYERRGEPALFQPLVRAALSAIDACADGLDRRALFRYLCAGPVDVGALAGRDEIIDPHELNALARDAGVENFFGADAANPAAAWRKRLDQFLIRTKAPAPRKRLAGALCAIVERFQKLREKRTVAASALAWKSFFRWNAQPDFSATERLVLQALYEALDEVATGPNARTQSVDPAAFRDLVNAAVVEHSVRAAGTERAGVRVLNFYDLRGVEFKRVVLGGMAEGQCPARAGADALLGGGCEKDVRDALLKQIDHADGAQHLSPRLAGEVEDEERALFDSALSCARQQVLLARPEHAFDGAHLGASEYWRELLEKTGASVEACASIHPAPPLAECLTAEERELRAAWVLGGGGGADNAAERAGAVAEFNAPTRLKSLAASAAVEQQRMQSFSDHAAELAVREAEQKAGAPNPLPDLPEPDEETAARVVARLAQGGTGPLLSPSDLENLAACPFKFFAQKICGLKEFEEPGDELSPADAGTLWHNIFARFYKAELEAAKTRGEFVARLDSSRRAEYLDSLLALAGTVLDEAEGKLFTGPPGFWKLMRARVPRVLSSWLDCELHTREDGFYPALIEFSFGPEQREGDGRELLVPLFSGGANSAAGALRVRGRMDRLDLRLDEVDGISTVVAVRVIDYKSGAARNQRDKVKPQTVESLLNAQLPLYLAAAIEHLPQFCAQHNLGVDLPRVWGDSRAGYYSIKDAPLGARGDSAPLVEIKEWPLGALQTFVDLRSQEDLSLFSRVQHAVRGVLSGEFPVQPLACAGSDCPARQACRYVALPALGEEEEG